MNGGVWKKVLWVDMSNNEIVEKKLNDDLYRLYIGGYGIGARIIFSQQKAGADPLGPSNIIGFLTGPLTGTMALSGTRHTVVGKSPLTGGWGDSSSGGFFGAFLKFAGYDGVFFTGISKKPVYLLIDNGKAELRDASHLWGKDTYETEERIKSELGKEVQVACIGPAGEKLSLISAIIHCKGRAAARSGLGAVMGSKRLKAIAVTGNKNVPVVNEEKLKELRRKYISKLQGALFETLRKYGTSGHLSVNAFIGDAPTKNWSGYAGVDLPEYEQIGGEAIVAKEERKFTCYLCPIGCGGYMRRGCGEYDYETGVHKPEYETLAMFGTNLLNSSLDSIIKINDICNRYGVDTISAGATIAFVIECFENGIITEKDTDGLQMTWGNHKSIVAMVEKLAKREGFGDVIADGVKKAAEKISKKTGKDVNNIAIHIGGQEVPAHSPLCFPLLAVTYRLDATPARHTQKSAFMRPSDFLRIKPETIDWETLKRGICFHHVVVCAGYCLFVYDSLFSPEAVIEFIEAVTGWNVTFEELIMVGERIANIRQAFNIREGLNPLKFKVPDRCLGRPPINYGPLAGITINEEVESFMVKSFLKVMDWDAETAKPSKKKLQELGLNDIAEELYPQDIF
ncbi:MAG: aldehyde ferredoxin oxidoreductase family protein [Candidatus Bathyarchaeia archaeon]